MKNDAITENLKSFIKDYYQGNFGESLIDKKQYTCPNPSHLDKHPSATFYENKKAIYCHACGQYYDLFNLIRFKENLNEKEAYKRACELYLPTQIKDKTKFDYWHESLLDDEKAKSFIFSRGFNLDTIKRFKLGYASDYGNLVIPVSAVQYTIRNLENDKDKRVYKKNNGNEETKLFNWQVASAKTCLDYCFVCEGEFDAMSFEQIGVHAVGLRSAENINLIFSTFKDKNITFVLALDNDETGKTQQKKLYAKLIELGFKEPKSFDLGIYKDPNEMFMKSAENFSKQAHSIVDMILKEKNQNEPKQAEESEYNKLNNYHALTNFENYIEKNKNSKPLSTGFNQLDKMLDGGLRAYIYVLCAISSLGKTTFTMQIADYTAMQGSDVLIFSLEMSKYQLIAKSLSRIIAETEPSVNRKSTSEISNPYHYVSYSEHEMNVISRAKDNYRKYANNIFVVENNNGITALDIYNTIKKHIQERNKKPVVIVDYMQLISSLNDSFSDKQNMDKLMALMKKCIKEFEVPIILISSINRDAYTQKISMQSIKESGGIEFSAEVVLGMQYKNTGKDFDIDLAKKQNPREIELILLKNRFGLAGESIFYEFFPAYNLYKEIEETNTNLFNQG